MINTKLFSSVAIIISLCFLSVASGAETSEIFSPVMADSFREKAVALYDEPNAANAAARQAMAFLDAASRLDGTADHTLPDMIRLAWRFPSVDAHEQVRSLFGKYAVNDDADLEVLRLSVQYLLEPMNSREEREQFFTAILRNLGTRHQLLSSDVATQLGILASEGSDMQAAEFYFMQAYNDNSYNKLAFEKLMEIRASAISPAIYLRHLRLMMGSNPYNIDMAFAFANSAYNIGLYDVAASAYKYCADLFTALHPNQPLPPAIYLMWALSNYNQPKGLKQCLDIAESIDKGGRFDLYLEAIAGNAAIKLGNTADGAKILETAAQKAIQMVAQKQLKEHDVAWFYCFAQPDPEKALAWANKANADEPNSPRTAAILAYALVMNGQPQIAKPLVETDYKGNQIAGLAMGQIPTADDPNTDPNAALGIIKSAIAIDAGSLEAQRGKELITQKGSIYVPVYETTMILKALQSEFGDDVINDFVTADKLIAVKISISGNEFSYGGRLDASLIITNKGGDPLVINDGCLFNGNIKVDAVVKGDLNERIPDVVLQKIRPSEPVGPKRSIYIPLELTKGRLGRLLFEYPQASVKVEFTAYIDPVKDANGAIHNALAAVEPARAAIKRNAVDVSGIYLQTRLDTLASGQPGQKTKTAQLFAGLLLEERDTAGSKPYKMTYIDPQLLRSGLVRCLVNENWSLMADTMLMLGDLPLDFNLTDAVSENLGSKFWPVRMTALWLLGKGNGRPFQKVLEWTAKNDDDQMVLEMAGALGASVPKLAAKNNPAEPNESANKTAMVKEPNKPVSPVYTKPLGQPVQPKTVSAEPNQPKRKEAKLAEPNQPPKATLPEPNQIPKGKAAEPNTSNLIEDILKQ